MECFAGVVGHLPAHAVAEKCGVLCFEGIAFFLEQAIEAETNIKAFFKEIDEVGVFDQFWNFVAVSWRKLLPLQIIDHSMPLEVTEDSVITH